MNNINDPFRTTAFRQFDNAIQQDSHHKRPPKLKPAWITWKPKISWARFTRSEEPIDKWLVVVNEETKAYPDETDKMTAMRQTFGPQDTPTSRWGAESWEAHYISPSPAGKIVANSRYKHINNAMPSDNIAKIKKARMSLPLIIKWSGRSNDHMFNSVKVWEGLFSP